MSKAKFKLKETKCLLLGAITKEIVSKGSKGTYLEIF